MKRFINFLGIGLMVALTMLFSRPVDAQPGVGVSINFQTFYDELSPYGDWIDYPEYGYTWRPRVSADFRPYATNGNWVYTDDYDWMWNSGYNWGWAPFHYGRWFNDPMYGWLWVPGYDWSPAWVSWRGGGDYYGWAPIRPGISINIGFGGYNPPYDYWTFAPCRYMTSSYISKYYYPYRNNVNIFNRTTIINNYYGDRNGGRRGSYVNGPRRTDVERYTGRINPVSVRSANKPGRTSLSRNDISVYRPTVQRGNNNNSSMYAPRSVQRYDGNNNGIASRNTVRRNDNPTRVMRDNSNNSNTESRINTSPRRADGTNSNRTISGDNNRTDNNAATGNRNIMRQRSANTDNTNDNNTRIRSQQIQQQRSMQMPQSESRQRVVQPRVQSQPQSRSMQSSSPRVERSAPSRSFESRSSSAGSSRGGGGGGIRASSGRRGR